MEEIAIFRAVTHHASCVDGGSGVDKVVGELVLLEF